MAKEFFVALICSGIVFLAPDSFGASPPGSKLPTQVFQVCGSSMTLELAQTPEHRSRGLMFRQSIPAGTGMLFVFPFGQSLAFWMKNCPIDIDVGYFNDKGKLLNHHTMKATSPLQIEDSLPRYESRGQAKYAVETQAGFYKSLSPQQKKNCRLSPLLTTSH